MTPDHKTDTLEGLIASMEHEPRSFVDDEGVLRTSTINRHAATCKKCRAERILAALRELRNEHKVLADYYGNDYETSSLCQVHGTVAKDLDEWLGQPATAPDKSSAPPATQVGEDDAARARNILFTKWPHHWGQIRKWDKNEREQAIDYLAAEFSAIRAEERNRARREEPEEPDFD